MDANQTKIIDLLREVHLIAFREIERLNLRIAELDSHQHRPVEKQSFAKQPTADVPPPAKVSEMLNEHQVAEFLNMSVASVRRWRLFRTGPKFVKIGSAVRYKKSEVEVWLDSCANP